MSNYLKLSGKTYLLSEVEAEGDIEQELEKFYQAKAEKLKQELLNKFTSEAEEDRERILQHLRKFTSKGVVNLPEALFSMPLYYSNYYKEFGEIRIILYSPIYYEGDGSTILRYIPSKSEKLKQDKVYIVTVKNAPLIPLQVVFYDKARKVQTFPQTFHSLDTYLCLGDNTYEKFKALPLEELTKGMRITNLFSTARSSIQGMYGDVYELTELLSEENIKSIKEKKSQWTTESSEK